MDPKIGATQRGSWMIVKQLDIVDDYTVKLSLSKPSASLLALFATMRESAIPNKETVEKNGDLANVAVGTGPFKLAEFVPGDHVRYVRNPDYWVKELPYLDEFTLKVMPEEDQRIAALRSGQIHLGLLSPVGAQRLASEQQLTVMHSPKALVMMILINSQRKPFDDVRVRKALSLAVDRQAFITKAVQGEGVISGPTPTGHTDWFVPPEQLPYKQDVDGAKKLLAEAGFPNGFKSTLKTTGAIPEQAANAVELKNQLQAVGIDVSIEQLEIGAHTKATGVGIPADQINDYDLITSNFTFYPGPDTYVGNFLPERNAITRGNNEGMKNPQITALLDKAEATQDHAERRKLSIDAQLQLIEMYPALWLYAVNQIDGVSNKLRGYKQSFTARRFLIKQAWAG
jgi:peptide/nickel transport system substrate-binding protein